MSTLYNRFSDEVQCAGNGLYGQSMVMRPLSVEMAKQGSQSQNGSGMKLLGLGTGNGSFLIQLREAFSKLELCGLDLSPAMVEFGKKRFRQSRSSMGKASLIQARMTNTPWIV